MVTCKSMTNYKVVWRIHFEKPATMDVGHSGLVVESDSLKKFSKDQTDVVKLVKRWLEHFWSKLHMGKKSELNLKTAWQRLKAWRGKG